MMDFCKEFVDGNDIIDRFWFRSIRRLQFRDEVLFTGLAVDPRSERTDHFLHAILSRHTQRRPKIIDL